jgi:hypothetical protein
MAIRDRVPALPLVGIVTLAIAALAAVGCGGSVAVDAPDAAGGSDASIDASAPDTARRDDGPRVDSRPSFDTATTCPATVPTKGSPCGPISLACTYKGSCGEDFAQCVDGAWSVIRAACGTEYCPIYLPATGASCSTEGYLCEYPKASDGSLTWDSCTICVCKGGSFYCDPHPIAECPLPRCLTGDACTTPHMIGCEYGGKCGTSCRCGESGTLSCPTRLC